MTRTQKVRPDSAVDLLGGPGDIDLWLSWVCSGWCLLDSSFDHEREKAAQLHAEKGCFAVNAQAQLFEVEFVERHHDNHGQHLGQRRHFRAVRHAHKRPAKTRVIRDSSQMRFH